jgi:cobalt/nickel transport system ATP-binding protein
LSAALEVVNLRVTRDGRRVLDDVSFHLDENEGLCVLGRNGAGKSTLLWALAGLLRHEGTATWFGETRRPAPGRIGFVFQNPEDQLFLPSLLDDLMLPLRNAGVKREEAETRAQEALEAVGLGELAEREAAQLSLGQRKRAAIALALVRRPEALLLDEPSAELDGSSVRRLAALLRALRQPRIVATHHLEFAREVASRAVVLDEGRVVAQGPMGEVLGDAALLERCGLV